MSVGTFTDGAVTLPRTALPRALGAINTVEERQARTMLGSAADLAERLLELASGDDGGGARDDYTIEDSAEVITITIMVGEGRPERVWSSWLKLLHVLATHGAIGAFLHEDEQGRRSRTRLEGGLVHEDIQVYSGDVTYLAQLQRRDGERLDFVAVRATEDEAFIALLAELNDRQAPHPAPTGSGSHRQRLERWADHAGLAWRLRPLPA